MDTLTPERRSWVMSRIRSADTGPERIVRSVLHRLGYRFRKDTGLRLPGKPDIVLPKYGTVIFVHGCFWHRHPGCRQATNPKTRKKFWTDKFARNVKRDARVRRQLRKAGWRIITIWECDVYKGEKLRKRLERVLAKERTEIVS